MPGSPVVNLRNTFGAEFIGLFLSTILTGLEIVQAWIYCWNYWNKDNRAFKSFMGILTAISISSTFVSAYTIYWYLVLNFGNVQSLGDRPFAAALQTILILIPCPVVQLYYTRRVYLVSQSIIFPIIVTPIILGGTIFDIYVVVRATVKKDFHSSILLPSLWTGASVLTDILITVAMSWTLYRKKTGFARTDSMIMTLMVYSINSGFLLSTLGAATAISFAVAPTSFIYLAFVTVMSKCYMNSLYAMLNTRDYVRDRSTSGNPENAYNLTSIRLEPPKEAHGSKSKQPGVTVTVHRSTTTDFTRSKSDHIVVPTFEDPKPGDAEL